MPRAEFADFRRFLLAAALGIPKISSRGRDFIQNRAWACRYRCVDLGRGTNSISRSRSQAPFIPPPEMEPEVAEILAAPPDPERPYVYRGTRCHINKFGILNPAALEQVIRCTTRLRADALKANPIAGDFDLAHLQAIHRYLFQDVYDWAGELRLIDFSRSEEFFSKAEGRCGRSGAAAVRFGSAGSLCEIGCHRRRVSPTVRRAGAEELLARARSPDVRRTWYAIPQRPVPYPSVPRWQWTDVSHVYPRFGGRGRLGTRPGLDSTRPAARIGLPRPLRRPVRISSTSSTSRSANASVTRTPYDVLGQSTTFVFTKEKAGGPSPRSAPSVDGAAGRSADARGAHRHEPRRRAGVRGGRSARHAPPGDLRRQPFIG